MCFPGRMRGRALEMVGEQVLGEMRGMMEESGVFGDLRSPGQEVRMVIFEGFTLFDVVEIRERFDVRLFVRLSRGEAKRRRMNRPNYGSEAKEGEFWKTEDYFEKMVWRNYVEQHGEFFEEGDVEGKADEERCERLGIAVQGGMDVEVQESLRWAVGAILEGLKGKSL